MEKERVVDYALCVGLVIPESGIFELEDAVKRLIKTGWEPFGGPFKLERDGKCVQALVKREQK